MDKVFSTRLDENLIRKVNILSVKKSMSKKTLIEQALRKYINDIDDQLDSDIINRSFGAWQREETPDKTIAGAKQAFRDSFFRNGRTGESQ